MKTIAIIGALPSELKGVQSAQVSPVVTEIAGYAFHESTCGSNRLVTVCCGIGKVNAACCTQLLIDRFGADVIINTGIAGGMKTAAIGDAVYCGKADHILKSIEDLLEILP